jgi:hypothetical protein
VAAPECIQVFESSQYRAPTWSWASLDGEIFLNYHITKDLKLMVEGGEVWMQYSNDSNSRAIRAHSLSNIRFQGVSPVNFAPESIASKSKAWMVGGASPAWKFNWRSISQVPIFSSRSTYFPYPLGSLTPTLKANTMDLFSKQEMHLGFQGCGILTVNDDTTSFYS